MPTRTVPSRFSAAVVAALDKGKILGLRAGDDGHRFIGLWVVVVEGRVFVRSWSLKQRSWWRTFLRTPEGSIQVGKRTLRVRALQTRSERLKAAVSRAYREKYATPGAVQYARDLGRPRSVATTTELLPLTATSQKALGGSGAKPRSGGRAASPSAGRRTRSS
jgi:hypothetical protein